AREPANRPARPAPAAGRPHDPRPRPRDRRRDRRRPADRLPPGPRWLPALHAVGTARLVAPGARGRPGARPADPRARAARAMEAHRGPDGPGPSPTPLPARTGGNLMSG